MTDTNAIMDAILARWDGVALRVKPTRASLEKAAKILGFPKEIPPRHEVVEVDEETSEKILAAISRSEEKPIEASIEL